MLFESHFEFCTPFSRRKWLHTGVSFGTGLAVALLVKLLLLRMKSSDVRTTRDTPLHLFFIIMTPVMTLLGTLTFFAESIHQSNSFVSCASFVPPEQSFYAVVKLLTFTVHNFFMVRALVIWTVSSYLEVLTTIFNTALFIQDMMGWVAQQHLLAFQYIILHSYYCFETKQFFNHLLERYIPRYKDYLRLLGNLCLVIILLAGTLRLVEEWNTNDDFLLLTEIPESEMESLWSYVYWTVVTISTVGFGDITPATIAGKVVIMIIICSSFIVWYNNITVRLYDLVSLQENQLQSDLLFIINCKERDQLADIKCILPDEKSHYIRVFINNQNRHVLDMVQNLGLEAIQGTSIHEIIRSNLCLGKKENTFLILHDPSKTPRESDEFSLDLVRSIRGYGCKATLLVEMREFSSQKLISKVQGWNHKTGVCMSLDFATAHVLALSAHSRLAPALITHSVVKQFKIVTDRRPEIDYIENLKEDYLTKNRLILGVINDENDVVLFPDKVKPSMRRITLMNNDYKVEICHRKVNLEQEDIKTSAISSKVSVFGESVLESLDKALECHNVTKVDYDQQSNATIISSINPLDILEAKKENLGQTCLISTLEHGYESCCIQREGCICGNYDATALPRNLLITAYIDRPLHDLWMKLLSEDYLQAETIDVECSYKDLFMQSIVRQKIPLGVETCHRLNSCLRLPVVNPSNLELHKGDVVLYIKKPRVSST